MNIKLAKNYGFCFGVKRAIGIAKRIEGKANSLGPLIHNPQVIDYLKKKGITAKDSLGKINKKKVIIRAHGIPDSVLKKLKKKKCKIIDATCPFVKKAQHIAKMSEKQGYQVILIGEKSHPEVKGIIGNLRKKIVIEHIDDVKKLKKHRKIAIISQTTQSKAKVDSIVKELRKKSQEVKVFDTICNATAERQLAAINLARYSDLMIVIGGKNSANTKQLARLCSTITKTKHIESASDLKKPWFKGIKQVGITAGASTPNYVVKKVIEKIKEF